MPDPVLQILHSACGSVYGDRKPASSMVTMSVPFRTSIPVILHLLCHSEPLSVILSEAKNLIQQLNNSK